jgi:hypothetical protein
VCFSLFMVGRGSGRGKGKRVEMSHAAIDREKGFFVE